MQLINPALSWSNSPSTSPSTMILKCTCGKMPSHLRFNKESQCTSLPIIYFRYKPVMVIHKWPQYSRHWICNGIWGLWRREQVPQAWITCIPENAYRRLRYLLLAPILLFVRWQITCTVEHATVFLLALFLLTYGLSLYSIVSYINIVV